VTAWLAPLIRSYRLRVLSTTVLSLLLVVAVVRWWPAPGSPSSDATFSARGQETVQMEEIQPTSHAIEKAPPPPAPAPPVVVPNDRIIEFEFEMTDSALPVDDPGDDDERQQASSGATAGQRPDANARLLRYVEPTYTQSARKNNVRAQVVVEVLVSPAGKVQEATVLERRLLADDGKAKRTVDRLGYGLEEAALSAARRCLFRPATNGGEPVATRTTLTIRFGS
jgi:protein TonB